jgi:hypothetical protein
VQFRLVDSIREPGKHDVRFLKSWLADLENRDGDRGLNVVKPTLLMNTPCIPSMECKEWTGEAGEH